MVSTRECWAHDGRVALGVSDMVGMQGQRTKRVLRSYGIKKKGIDREGISDSFKMMIDGG